jgi:hypothetical protein
MFFWFPPAGFLGIRAETLQSGNGLMKHRDRGPEQDDLLRARLTDIIDMRHELVKLAGLMDWEWFEKDWAGFFPARDGRPATHPRLVAGLMYLQHLHKLSDEAAAARWVENPYFQHFTVETFFQHLPPIHPSSLSRWRGRIGEEGAEWLLTKTIAAGRTSGPIDDGSVRRVAVDTTVMEKTIAHPTDARLYERARSDARTHGAPAPPQRDRAGNWPHEIRRTSRQVPPQRHDRGYYLRGPVRLRPQPAQDTRTPEGSLAVNSRVAVSPSPITAASSAF